MHTLIPALREILRVELLAPSNNKATAEKPVILIEHRTDGWLRAHFNNVSWPAIFLSSPGGNFEKGPVEKTIDQLLDVKVLIGFQHVEPDEAAFNDPNSATVLFDRVLDILRKNKRLERIVKEGEKAIKIADALDAEIPWKDFDMTDPNTKGFNFFGYARNIFLQFRRTFIEWQSDFNNVGPVITDGYK